MCKSLNDSDWAGVTSSLEEVSQCSSNVSTMLMETTADTASALVNSTSFPDQLAYLRNASAIINGTLGDNVTTDVDDSLWLFPAWWADFLSVITIVVPVFYGITFLFGFVGNLLVVLVITRYSNMKTLANVYILNLALADCLFMLTIPFVSYEFLKHEWIFGHAMCKIVLSVDGMNQFTGVFLLTAMSLDRYLAFVHPIKSLSFRILRNTRIVCVLMWTLSGLVCLPLWMYTSTVPLGPGSVRCTITWSADLYKAFVVYAFVLGYALPLTIIAVCYVSIFRLILTNKQPGENGGGKKNSKRVAILIISAVIVFAICWLPFYSNQLHYTFFAQPGSISLAGNIAHIVGVCMGYGNSAINPIIYSFVGRNFKQNIKRLLLCKRARRSRSMYASSTHKTYISQRLTRNGRQNSRNVTSDSDSTPNIADVIVTYDNAAFQETPGDSSGKLPNSNHDTRQLDMQGKQDEGCEKENTKNTQTSSEHIDLPKAVHDDTGLAVPLRDLSVKTDFLQD
ncbi:somatostatin receptor type 2-like [Ptychodera flava]|uniref:somatostatin receptor type 2-like n=1 Tax=Ptychodera flava TaxID=63121 RepID=UPI003969D606